MEIRLYNALHKKVEAFTPIHEGLVSMYHCGPTVYGRAHIGNLRAYVFADILRRTFEYAGLSVKQVINITDIGHLSSDADEGEDKMLKGLQREGFPLTLQGLTALADKYEIAFKNDLATLNIETDNTVFPRASQHVTEEIALIEALKEAGFAYDTMQGVYFDTSKAPNYGKLGGLTPIEESKDRVNANGKKNARDFALWKVSKDQVGFESPFGRGFPGWHIECSAMSMKYLGQTFDIHTGGIDHIPVHHNNEIAQSENATGKPYARFFLHNNFVNISDTKMSKSKGNDWSLDSLRAYNTQPLAYRLLLLQASYQSQIELSPDSLKAAEAAYTKLRNKVANLPSEGTVSPAYKTQFEAAIGNNLNTPEALAILFKLLQDSSVSDADKKATALLFDKVLALDLAIPLSNTEIPAEILEKFTAYESAKKSRDFATSDSLRNEIKALGFAIEDSVTGSKIRKV